MSISIYSDTITTSEKSITPVHWLQDSKLVPLAQLKHQEGSCVNSLKEAIQELTHPCSINTIYLNNTSNKIRKADLCEDTEGEGRESGDDDEVESKAGREDSNDELVADDDDEEGVVEEGCMEEEECEEDMTLQSQSLLGG